MIVSDRAPAVDGGVGADLHVVADDHAADLRHLQVALGAHREPEPVLADAHTGMDDDAVADDGMRQRGAGTDVAVPAHHHPESDHSAGRNRRAGTDHGFAADDGTRLYDGALRDLGRRMHQRAARVGDAGGRLAAQGVHVEQAQSQGEGVVWRGGRQRRRGAGSALGVGASQDTGAGLGGAELSGVFAVVEEGQVVGARVAQRLHVADHARPVTVVRQDRADFLGDVAQSERTGPVKKARMLHGLSLARPAVLGPRRSPSASKPQDDTQYNRLVPDHARRRRPASAIGERINITGNCATVPP